MLKLFEPGQVCMTSDVSVCMSENPDFAQVAMDAVHRHLSGDWGDLTNDDRDLNNAALVTGDRLFSVYKAPCDNEWLYVITEGDRSSTLLMFPSEY